MEMFTFDFIKVASGNQGGVCTTTVEPIIMGVSDKRYSLRASIWYMTRQKSEPWGEVFSWKT
jgi:hypothetical protein